MEILEHNTISVTEIPSQRLDKERLSNIAGLCLSVAEVAQKAAAVERVLRYSNGERENDAEHSFMLSLIACEVANELYPKLDIGLVAQLANVHDLVETETKHGDTSTFSLSHEGLKAKKLEEEVAMHRLKARLPAHTKSMVEIYEAQEAPEALFVRKIDKLMPVVVEIISEGQGTRILQEDEGVNTVEQLVKADQKLRTRQSTDIPEFEELDEVRALMGSRFIKQFSRELSERKKQQGFA